MIFDKYANTKSNVPNSAHETTTGHPTPVVSTATTIIYHYQFYQITSNKLIAGRPIGNSQPLSAAGYTHFITSPVSKDATGTLPLRNLQVITDSYGQTVVTPQNKPTGAENKR